MINTNPGTQNNPQNPAKQDDQKVPGGSDDQQKSVAPEKPDDQHQRDPQKK